MEKKVIDLSKEKGNIQLILPEGYEVSKNNNGNWGIRQIDPYRDCPKSFNDFCNKNKNGAGDYFMKNSGEVGLMFTGIDRKYYGVTMCATKEDAEAFVALIQLRRLWHEWVKVLGTPETDCYDIYNDEERGISVVSSSYPHALSFVEQSQAEKFIECFPELLEKAKILL